jgi:hypothetical protein
LGSGLEGWEETKAANAVKGLTESGPFAAANPAATAQGGSSAPSSSGAKLAAAVDPETESKFIETVRAGGLTNPTALAAVAAYGNAESKYDPANVSRTWSDPSQSGVPGTSGGVMSWRDDRLKRMQEFVAQQGGDPVVAQAKFFLAEDPSLVQRLNAAKTPEEANGLMANAWKFAGYNQPGGEFDNRLNLTRSYLGKLGGGEKPVQVASADPNFMPQQYARLWTKPLPESAPLPPERPAELSAPPAGPGAGAERQSERGRCGTRTRRFHSLLRP